MEIIWNEDKERKAVHIKRTWDVRITLNKCGKGNKMVVRFGFLNKAVKAFKKNYIEMSKIASNRIYFRLFDNKANSNVYKLSKNKAAIDPGMYATISVSEEQEKLYRAKWINGTFNLLFDDENQLYYIENTNM